jgi:L-asparaginase
VTIDKQYDATSQYQISDSFVPRLLGMARVMHPFECRELLQKDSLDLTAADRELILHTVRTSGFTRIVITHGTDTMTQTAQVLRGVEGKTIVPRAPRHRHASTNGRAVQSRHGFAAAQIAPPGVYIAMNGTLFQGDRW